MIRVRGTCTDTDKPMLFSFANVCGHTEANRSVASISMFSLIVDRDEGVEGSRPKISWIVKAPMAVQSIDGFHFSIT